MGFLDDLLNIGGQVGDVKGQVEETVQGITDGATEPLQDITGTADDLKQQASDATGGLLGGDAGNEEK